VRTSAAFSPADSGAITDFVHTHPLAQVVSWSEDRVEATPLPLIAEVDKHGAIRAIERLLDHVEGDGASRWQSAELEERYHRLPRGVVGFRATVIEGGRPRLHELE
jgi:hypothetical protein